MAQLEVTQSEFRASAARMVFPSSAIILPRCRMCAPIRRSLARRHWRHSRSPAPSKACADRPSMHWTLSSICRAPRARAFFGYVLGSGEPVAALADLLASVLNQNVTAWRSAPAAVTIERQVVRWIADALGCEIHGRKSVWWRILGEPDGACDWRVNRGCRPTRAAHDRESSMCRLKPTCRSPKRSHCWESVGGIYTPSKLMSDFV